MDEETEAILRLLWYVLKEAKWQLNADGARRPGVDFRRIVCAGVPYR